MARVKLKRIETSICSIISISLSTSIFGLPMVNDKYFVSLFFAIIYKCGLETY